MVGVCSRLGRQASGARNIAEARRIKGVLGEMKAGEKKLADLQDGESLDFKGTAKTGNLTNPDGSMKDFVDRLKESPDFALAFGRLNNDSFKSEINVKATREGNTIHIRGTVTHSLTDQYEFDPEDRGASLARPLQQSGRGTPFGNHHSWKQEVEGTIPILADETFGRPTINWGKVPR